MFSAVLPVLPAEPVMENPFSVFNSGFPLIESSFQNFPSPHCSSPFTSKSSSDDPSLEKHDQNQNQKQKETNTGFGEPNRDVVFVDERKLRRMISNRESARRSRMRKQKHMEYLRCQVNRLRMENRELWNRLCFAVYHCQRVRLENDSLLSEHHVLRQKLSDTRQLLVSRQLQNFQIAAYP